MMDLGSAMPVLVFVVVAFAVYLLVVWAIGKGKR